MRAGIVYILHHNERNGHTCLPKEKLLKVSTDFLGIDGEKVSECMEEMLFDRSLIEDKIDGKKFVFPPNVHLCEMYIASRIKMLLKFPSEKIKNIDKAIEKCEKEDGIEYADLQKKAITMALTEGMLVLTGGPGTGKTTTLNAIIKIMKANGKTVLLSAPTGRAAQRMSELTGDEAKTLHRLLEVSWDKHDNPVFNKNERNQLKCDALIVDEVSMVDTFIMESVMRALSTGCRLILVGDSDQLPSVGPGNVLGDLIESGLIPVVRLNEIFRQAQQSLIVTNAHKIVNGEIPILNSADKDFFFLQRNNKSEVSAVIADLCANRLPKAYGYSPFENIQVLAPSKKGELGTAELNHKLQAALNPKDDDKSEITIGSKTFRTGDKVMQIKNNYQTEWEKKSKYGVTYDAGSGVFNGDTGIITEINTFMEQMTVKFDDERIVKYDFKQLEELELAYAITVHKSQGSEYPAVVIPMYPGPRMLMNKNLLYTAVTRARKCVCMVGNENCFHQMAQNESEQRRYSSLDERIKEIYELDNVV